MTQMLNILSRHGSCASQPKEDWRGDIRLPPELTEYYARIGPKNIELPWHGNNLYLPSLKALWDRQAGYRWHGVTGEVLSDWPDNWIVIAQSGGDPFIFDLQSGHVLFAIAGTGDWAGADDLFDDITSFVHSATTLSEICNDTPDFYDDDFNINPQSILIARQKLAKINRTLEKADAILTAMGWLSP